MSCQRRGLLLFHLLAFLLFLSFSSAQSSNTTSDFVLTVPETLLLCQVVELSWSSANDTVPLYEVYLATGSGAIGDSNSLSPETWIAAVGNTTLEWQLKPVWAIVGDVIRFRVQPREENGPNATAWSSVTGSSCNSTQSTTTQAIISNSFLVSVHSTGLVTTKNTDTQTLDLITAATGTTTGNNGAQGSPGTSPGTQDTNTPSQASPASFIPGTAPPAGLSGSTADADTPGGGSILSVIPGDFTSFGNTITAAQPQTSHLVGNGQSAAPQPSLVAAPNESDSEDTSPQQSGSISPQVIGAIVATVCIATALWCCFVLWRRRRRRRAVAVLPRESTSSGSAGELLTSSSDASSTSAPRQAMAAASTYSQRQTLTIQAPAIGRGARVPPYNDATRLYSPLETPDPFRHSFGPLRAQSNPRP